jgi:hypothetical protein
MPKMTYDILKLENGDFVKVAQRDEKSRAIRYATWAASTSTDENGAFEVRESEGQKKIVLIQRTNTHA